MNLLLLRNFATFISQKSVARLASANCQIRIESLDEFGQLCHPLEDVAASSPDAIAGNDDEETPDGKSYFVALVEMKSKCSKVTLTREMELVDEFRKYQEINIEEDPEVFKASIPDVSMSTPPWYGFGLFEPHILRSCLIATEDNPRGSCSRRILDTRTVLCFGNCKSGSTT